MSTNDEIRKAAERTLDDYSKAEAVDHDVFAETMRGYGGAWSDHRRSFNNGYAQALADMRALAPYLAPHPAQQGEDGELLDWLDKNGNWWAPGRHVDGYERISRAAIRAARARSHSKQ